MNNVIGLMKVIFTSKTKEDFRKHNDYVRKQKKSEKVFQLSPIQYPDPCFLYCWILRLKIN